ncbi:MAG: alpha-galactosidase [Arachnia propionica]|uniref:alpha-galactosidase n=1 Tax=Arachnia propionica TaxID=1750 RepID=UPI00270EA652|nr:alpha-galactosidase [Arachnia propionica]
MPPRIAARAAGVALLIASHEDGMPQVVHWGSDPGELDEDRFDALAAGAAWMRTGNGMDEALRVGVVPEARFGWTGTPGLIGSRDGRGWSPAWRTLEVLVDDTPVTGFVSTGPARIGFHLGAEAAELDLWLWLELLPTGLVRASAELTNLGDTDFDVTELTLRLPVPGRAREVLDFAGRWAAERMPQRHPLQVGSYRREGRHGRTGADASFVLTVGEEGFGYRTGEVWGCHVAWSGNHIHLAERELHGAQVIGGGELLLPGEGRLGRGEVHRTPRVYFNHASGLDAQAARFHEHLRALPAAPDVERPVTLNVWEAVYFDHDADRLLDLAERAAALGVERYVLDDGWFGARRDDTAGLGDWVVSPEVWPQGLHPLVDRVKALGMQFGLWFEPEMVNEDSDVARAHPEWIMQVEDRLPIRSRFQQVLNLAIPGAFEHVLGQMSALFEEYAIDYVKWDHNRDLVDAGTAPHGRAAVAAQTRAYYRLLDELRRRFPHVEFESCSSGGARIDLEVMERVQRVWVSDNIDPDDRQRMLWWTGQLLPTEVMGSHIASGRSHVTGRWHDLEYRAATAIFGHLGVEWDLARASDEELEALRWWIAWYKENRHRLLTGRLVRQGLPEKGVWFKGVVGDEGGIFSLALVENTPTAALGPILFPGLAADRLHEVRVINRQPVLERVQAPWLAGPPLRLTGAQLASVGLQAPILQPSTAVVFDIRPVD